MTQASLAAAWAWLDAVAFDGCEAVAVAKAGGRVLAEAVAAAADLPDGDRAAAGGYAVRAAETEGASPYNPVAPASGLQPVGCGMAMPPWADAVLPAEAVEGALLVMPVAAGEGVIRAGEQARAGAVFFAAGHRLRAVDVALLAWLGIAEVRVRRQPRVGLGMDGAEGLATLLRGLLAGDGAVADGADLLLVAGDAAPAGFVAAHCGVAIRPGGESALGWLGETPMVLLPGEPLACLAAYRLLAGRLVRRMAGLAAPAPVSATLRRKIASGIGYADFVLVRLIGGQAEPVGGLETAGLAGAARADGYVLVPPTSEGFAPGSAVGVHRLESAWT